MFILHPPYAPVGWVWTSGRNTRLHLWSIVICYTYFILITLFFITLLFGDIRFQDSYNWTTAGADASIDSGVSYIAVTVHTPRIARKESSRGKGPVSRYPL